ncbi:MAG: NADH-quinone oxidoreductase subunit H [Bacteroidota bacterium]
MEMTSIVTGLGTVCAMLAGAPLFAGIVNRQKAIFTGRIGAPVLQPYYELAKLFRKETVRSSNASFLSTVAPVINFAAVMVVVAMVPMGIVKPLLSFDGDLILFAYTLGLARFFQIIAAMDIGSSMEGMGAAREATFAVFAEPIFFFTIGSIAFISGTTSMYEIYNSVQLTNLSYSIFILVCSISVFLLAVAESSRMPVDDPTTHLELTMIHEVMILDNSGVDLFLYQYASYLRLLVYTMLEASLFNALGANPSMRFVYFGAVVALMTLVLALVETVSVRFKMVSIPQYLLFATAIGVLNLLIYTFTR